MRRLKIKEKHGSREKSGQKLKLCIGQQKGTSHENVNVVSGFSVSSKWIYEV